jgi:hypothetical protein
MTTYNHYFTDVFREIKSRIDSAKTGKLKELKTLRIGQIQKSFDLNELPLIYLNWDGFSESYEAQKKNNKSSEQRLVLHVYYPLYNNNTTENIYYNDDQEPYTGLIPFIEALMDVIHEDTSGTIDPRINQAARKTFDVVSDKLGKLDNCLELPINLTVKTQDFPINERYSD